MAAEEVGMQLEHGGHGGAKERMENTENGMANTQHQANDAESRDNSDDEMRRTMAQLLGLERLEQSPFVADHEETGGVDSSAEAEVAPGGWSKDEHIGMVADALAKELTAFKEQHGLQGTSEELAHLNQFLAIDYEVFKQHLRR